MKTETYTIKEEKSGSTVYHTVYAETPLGLQEGVAYIFRQYMPEGYATRIIDTQPTQIKIQRSASCD